MNENYYETLEIPRNSTSEAIANAFRRLAVKFHPAKNPSNVAANTAKFRSICEAYDVLSDPEKKAIFDLHGEYGLKNGVTNSAGQMIGGYMFMGNSEEIFESFFGGKDPLSNEFEVDGSDMYGSLLGDAHGAKNKLRPAPPKDVELEAKCSLYELYNGSIKTLTYSRDKCHWNNRTLDKVQESIKIEIKPGYCIGQVLTFKDMGNEQHTYNRSALKIKLVEDKTSKTNFMRRGDNLIYMHSLSLKDALSQTPIKFKTLDNRSLNLNLDIAITPQAVHKIPGEGMPIEKPYYDEENAPQKGDLYIKFDIQFPIGIADANRSKIVELLKMNAEET